MQIRKYQNSGKLDEGEIHVNIDPVTITPEPWQYALRDFPLKKYKNQIYSQTRNELRDVVDNPYQEEYNEAHNAWKKLQDLEYWPDNAMEIIENYSKAVDNYYNWDELNSYEGYKKLKQFHDNPEVNLTLTTYPWLDPSYLISHSAIYSTGEDNAWTPFVDVKMSDKGYNLLWNNCSDATKKLLEHIKQIKMPEKWHGITTPNQVKEWAIKKLGGKKVKYSKDIVNIPLNISEFNRWYNYER